MKRCIDHPEDCGMQNKINEITWDQVCRFFETGKVMKCSTSIVYVNGFKDGATLSELFVKQIGDECHVFFVRKGNWFFVYTGLLQRLVLWSKHPRSFGKEGMIGHHVSIGLRDDGEIDVHSTSYDSYAASVGTFKLIAPLAKHTWYRVDDSGDLVRKDGGDMEVEEHVAYLWKLIRCTVDDNDAALYSGGGIMKMIDYSKRSEHKRSHDRDMKRILHLMNTGTNGCIRTRYMDKKEMLAEAKKLRKMSSVTNSTQQTLAIVSDHDAMTSFVLCNT